MVRTRLDVVVKVKERAEEKAGQTLARAESMVTQARARLDQARDAAKTDLRQRADVSTWELTELAHQRALVDAKKAQKDLEQAQKQAAVVRNDYMAAWRSAEAVRRVAETRREEITRELARNEDKALDEVASQLWFRKAG